MKRVLGILVGAALLTAFLPRPAAAEVTLDLGIKGGVSLASITYSYGGEADNSSSSMNPIIGGFLAINFNKTFTFQPEVYFLTNGGKWVWDEEGYSFKEVEKIGCIHIPLLAKVHLTQEGKAIPIVFAGPAVDLILSAKGKYYVDGTFVDDYDFKPYIKHTNVSLVFGGGVEVMLDKLMLVLEGRYDLGLVDLHPEADEVYKPKALMVMIGLGF
jgi:hypothetical protein